MFEIPEFRGYSIYEGGTKVPSFIHIGRNSAVPSGRYSGLFHAVDILPTLLASTQQAGAFQLNSIDGVSHWNSFLSNNNLVTISNIKENIIVFTIFFRHQVQDNSWSTILMMKQ